VLDADCPRSGPDCFPRRWRKAITGAGGSPCRRRYCRRVPAHGSRAARAATRSPDRALRAGLLKKYRRAGRGPARRQPFPAARFAAKPDRLKNATRGRDGKSSWVEAAFARCRPPSPAHSTTVCDLLIAVGGSGVRPPPMRTIAATRPNAARSWCMGIAFASPAANSAVGKVGKTPRHIACRRAGSGTGQPGGTLGGSCDRTGRPGRQKPGGPSRWPALARKIASQVSGLPEIVLLKAKGRAAGCRQPLATLPL